MNKLGEFVAKEFREMIPPVVFFFFSFHLLVLFRALMLREYGVRLSAIAGATVAALLIGKVVLIADAVPAINRFPKKPLVYNVIWKTLVYMLGALVVHYLEHLVPIWWTKGSLVAANDELLAKIVWPHFWAIQLWLLVLFFMYCTIRELSAALGRDRIIRMFFCDPTAANSEPRTAVNSVIAPRRD